MKDRILFFLTVFNIFGGLLVFYDKLASKKWKRNRIREANLFLLSILGAGAGMYLAMLMFKHKTRKKKFMISLPILIILQIYLFYYIMRSPAWT